MEMVNEAKREIPVDETPILGHVPKIAEIHRADAATPRSIARMTEWVLPPHTNALGTAFGGVIVSWVDIAGVAAAQRYARAPVVTLSIDHLQFFAPVRVGYMVLLQAQVTYVGKTSMEVEAMVDAENTITGELFHAARAYVTYVALDDEGKPKPVPRYFPQTVEEREKFEQAERRREERRRWR